MPQHSTASPPTPLSNLVAADYHGYRPSPHSRPGAHIPPTPLSPTSTSSHLPLISGMSSVDGMRPVLPPYSPVPHPDSPYPYPFEDIRRRIYARSDNVTTGLSQMDLDVAHEQHVLQWQAYALNNGGMVSDSTLSPSSTPFPGLQYNPWTFLRRTASSGRRDDIPGSQASTRSSPSHQPVSLPPFSRGYRGLNSRKRSQDLRRQPKTRPPRRVESTQPRDTSPGLSSGEETVGDFNVGEHQPEPQHSPDESADDEDDADADADDRNWIDEDMGIEGVADDFLWFESQTDYVGQPEKRRERWEHRWEALLRVVSAPATFSRIGLTPTRYRVEVPSTRSRDKHPSCVAGCPLSHRQAPFRHIAGSPPRRLTQVDRHDEHPLCLCRNGFSPTRRAPRIAA
jgi:hypothetical protein